MGLSLAVTFSFCEEIWPKTSLTCQPHFQGEWGWHVRLAENMLLDSPHDPFQWFSIVYNFSHTQIFIASLLTYCTYTGQWLLTPWLQFNTDIPEGNNNWPRQALGTLPIGRYHCSHAYPGQDVNLYNQTIQSYASAICLAP